MDDQRTDRELIVQMWEDISKQNTELRKINQTLLQVIGAVGPIRTDVKTLQTGLEKFKKKNKLELKNIVNHLSQRRH